MAAAGAQLTPEQSDQLVQSIVANLRAQPKQPTDVSTPTRIDWNAVAQQSGTYLNPDQQAALAQIVQRMK